MKPYSAPLSLCLLMLPFQQPALAEKTSAPALILASEYSQDVALQGYWVCEKYDGIRAYWDGQQLISRNGLVISLPKALVQQLPALPVEGELWLGRGQFSALQSLIQQQNFNVKQWQTLRFMVFDLPHAAGNYRQRYQHLQQLVENKPFLQLPTYQPYSNQLALERQLVELSDNGGEGLILRDPDALYLATRSKALIKYKSYQDGEAEVVGYSQGQGKYQNMVGALLVKDAQGRQFKLGSGLSEQQRAEPPAIGSMVHYRYNGLTNKGKPRFARFVRQHQPL